MKVAALNCRNLKLPATSAAKELVAMNLMSSLLCLGLSVFFFVLLHIFVHRLLRPVRILSAIHWTYLVASFLGAGVGFFILPQTAIGDEHFFWSSAVGCFFGYGYVLLYGFLGPVTADRSAAAHMMLQIQRHRYDSKESLMADFSTDVFLAKRMREFEHARFLRFENGAVKLTPKAAVFAWLYFHMTKILKIEARQTYANYFCSETNQQ